MPLDAVATSYRQSAFFGEPSLQRRNRIALGVGVSLLLHALLLATYRHKPAPADADDVTRPRSIAVWLRRPPPPPPVPERQPEPAARATAPTPAASAQRKRRERVIAVTPEPATPSRPDVFAVEPEANPVQEGKEDAAPRFDPEAARKMARKLASGPDPATQGTAVGQFPAKPLATETKAARVISRTRRRDCKDGLPGGLLAPLFLAMDKKDSGCQW